MIRRSLHTLASRAALLLLLAVGGCEGTHIYVSDNDGLAKKAKTTYEKVDLLALAKADRLNNDKIRDGLLEASQKHFAYLRDFQIFAIVQHKLGSDAFRFRPGACRESIALDCTFTTRLSTLGIARQEDIQEIAGQAGTQRWIIALDGDAQGDVDFNRDILSQTGWLPAPNCDSNLEPTAIPDPVRSAAGDRISVVEKALLDLKEACAELGESQPFVAGEIGKAARAVEEAKRKYADLARQEKAAKDKLKELADEYSKLERESGPTAEERRADIIEQVRNLRRGVDAAGQVFALIGTQSAFAEESIGAVDILLSTAEGQTIDAAKLKDNPELAKAVIIAQALPGLASKAGASIAAYQAPPTASLIIAKQQAAIDLDWLGVQKRAAKDRVDILERQLTALRTEVTLLNLAQIDVEDMARCEGASGAQKALCEQHWYLAMSHYSQAVMRGRAATDAATIHIEHLDRAEQINATEYALRSWNNLIGPPIALLEAYHAGGIKPETIADLIIKAGALGFGGVVGGKVL